MFRDLIGKIPEALDGVLKFFGWTQVPTESGKRRRQAISSSVFGYAVALMREAGFTIEETQTILSETWGKVDPDDRRTD